MPLTRWIVGFITALVSSLPLAAAEEPEEQAPDLPAVIVTGSPLKAADAEADLVPKVTLRETGSRDVFGPKRVRETGARDVNDLAQHLPALSARPYNGGEAAAPSLSMRGLPDDGLTEYVHILIDGIPASPLPYGWTAFSFLPVTTDRIYALDYIRGAHAVRYSPNTVGGILNFITEPVSSTPVARARATFGSFGYRSVRTSVGASAGPLSWLATAVDRRGDGYRDGGAFDQQDLNLKLRYAWSSDRWLASSISHMDSDHKAPGGLTRAQFSADRFANARPFNQFTGDRQVADLVLHVGQGSGAFWEAFAYGSRTYRHLRAQRPHFGSAASISDWTDESHFIGAGVRFERPLRLGGHCHTLYGGLRYQREWIPAWQLASEPFPGGVGTPTLDARYETDTVSLHLDDTFHPGPRWTVRAGLRVELVPTTTGRDRLGGFEFEDDFLRVLPGFGVSYLLSHHASAFANYYEGFRAPQVWGYASATGSGALEFEKGRTAEVGVRVDEYAGFSGSATAWRVTYDDFGVFYTGAYENLGRIEAQGVDLVGTWDAGELLPDLHGLSLDASLTVQSSELRSGVNKGNQTPYAWKRKGALRLRYECAGWNASLGGTYVGSSFSDDANTRVESADGRLGRNPSAWLWDARVAKSLQLGSCARLELAAGATNLLDREWHVHSRGGFFGGGLVAGPPRQAYMSVDLNIDF